jgi:hypothetical protein
MWWLSRSTPKASVRIIAIPPGEAPLWVREKWIGLELPLLRWSSAETFIAFGAVSGPRTWLAQIWEMLRGRSQRVYGFTVDASRAVEILDRRSPEAAAWWRENGAELIVLGRGLIFHAEVCEIVRDNATPEIYLPIVRLSAASPDPAEAATLGRRMSNPGATARETNHGRNQKQHDRDEKDGLGDFDGYSGDAAKAQNACDQRNDQKGNDPA